MILGLKGLMDSQQYHGKVLVSLIGCAVREFSFNQSEALLRSE